MAPTDLLGAGSPQPSLCKNRNSCEAQKVSSASYSREDTSVHQVAESACLVSWGFSLPSQHEPHLEPRLAAGDIEEEGMCVLQAQVNQEQDPRDAYSRRGGEQGAHGGKPAPGTPWRRHSPGTSAPPPFLLLCPPWATLQGADHPLEGPPGLKDV